MKRFHQALTNGNNGERGMSLIEIVIVMALMGGLMVVIVSTVTKTANQAKVKETELAFNQLRSALQMYKMQVSHYPTTDLGLKALVEKPEGVKGWRGPYCEPELLKDAWGGEIQYESDGRSIAFHSAGDDEQLGTADDVSWPEPKEEAETH
jgi:general secretion pathway protein G